MFGYHNLFQFRDTELLINGNACWSQLCFIFVPFWDHGAYLWTSVFNTLSHHYYEDYREMHWKLGGRMLQLQGRVRQLLAYLEWGRHLKCTMGRLLASAGCTPGRLLPAVPGIGFSLAGNLQYPAKDYASAWQGGGSIEKHWHGRHHWATDKHFGYGTYDCIANLGSGGDPDKREAALLGFLEEYQKLVEGTVKVASILRS
ncbi:unnamed protein product [Symbiodinium pilosum]|uniref:Uncharacterized protein n=1 Tax=Symbiodinium pilosum TaxID=2952 RepID=A0A812VRM4_SYMPI|nr:unnamed protein product [Symbiodinium pilosum]